MKANLVLYAISTTLLLICCNNKKEVQIASDNEFSEEKAEISGQSSRCYLFDNGKDTIRLSYTEEGNEVEGWMNYDFYEKDGSIGKVEGKISGDTLKLKYNFLAEGTISEQEVYFLRKDNFRLYRGSGEMKMTNDSVLVYSNPREINFSDNTPLAELKNCPENFINSDYQKFYEQEKKN